jgi:hypothetical protein
MEIAALLALGSAGYFLAKQTQPSHPVARSALPRKEGFQGGNLQYKPSPSLEKQYGTLLGGPPPAAEPNPSGLTGFPGLHVPTYNPGLEGTTTATPDVRMTAGGIEANPVYEKKASIKSVLSGVEMSSQDFVHNNMQPFYGSRVRQNVDSFANTQNLDYMTGVGYNQIKKAEVETMFDTGKTPFGNPFGNESNTDFVQTRINDPRNRGGEKPFEPVRVAPAVGEKFGSTGKGGYQQIEVNDLMMKNMRRTDDLRTANNPKLTYATPVVPGQHYIGTTADADAIGEVRKHKPDRFYVDESGERFGPSTAEVGKETARSIQIMKHTTRPETSVEYTGPAQSQDYNTSYIVGSYKAPMAQQYAGAGYRNADASTYTTANTDAPLHDYGKEGFEARPNERDQTRERVMGLNVSPAEAGAGTVHFEDPSRPTRRAETVGNLRQAGVATGYAGGAPAITVWDPNDIARTTVRETTIFQDRYGIAAPADGPAKLTVYDPDDIARPTQKAQISAKSDYFGGPSASHKRSMNQTFAQNMRLNPNKQQIAKGRTPLAGNGNVGVFSGDLNQTTRKLDADSLNDRAPAVNYVPGVPAGVGDIGSMKYRVPVKLDVSMERFNDDMISAVENNPLNISLRKNARKDQSLLDGLLSDRAGQGYAPMPADA